MHFKAEVSIYFLPCISGVIFGIVSQRAKKVIVLRPRLNERKERERESVYGTFKFSMTRRKRRKVGERETKKEIFDSISRQKT